MVAATVEAPISCTHMRSSSVVGDGARLLCPVATLAAGSLLRLYTAASMAWEACSGCHGRVHVGYRDFELRRAAAGCAAAAHICICSCCCSQSTVEW